ncbi:hypothetical protein BJ875DRAFT_504826 [Amylocarpus encephaloides]|uniref:Uncharacterized protein n=1 Tax=Amylocarpus encephaloides TaxID=45428 RepID=A0A9P7YI52_9HELO|nr:hypothetical protein BJ875DRAFT_504826 [Amylocarpus encephaloides]
MRQSMTLRRLLLAPASIRGSFVPLNRAARPNACRNYSASPNIAQSSFWINLVPKPLRRSSPSDVIKKKAKSKEWNPATFFIIIFLLIGSMSIQMIALRNEFTAFSRRSDAKIGLLKEIIGRIKNGETVDVEGLLGTGDAQREKEWEEVLQEIEEEDAMWEQAKSRRSKKTNQPEPQTSSAPTETTDFIMTEDSPTPEKKKGKTPAGFY